LHFEKQNNYEFLVEKTTIFFQKNFNSHNSGVWLNVYLVIYIMGENGVIIFHNFKYHDSSKLVLVKQLRVP
jgi:hypothetical protein